MTEKSNSVFRSTDDVISMFFGLAIVGVIIFFLVNFIEKRKGTINIPGISTETKLELGDEKKSEISGNKNSVVVVKGDNLWKIAVAQYGDGYKWTEIAKLNKISNPGMIYVGQKLELPKIEETLAKGYLPKEEITTGMIEYKVQVGDSLWKIAEAQYKDGNQWTKIWQANKSKIRNPDKLEIGMTLSIYGKI